MKICLAKGIKYDAGHYETKIDFAGKPVYVSPDGEDVIRYKFEITGCLKTRKIMKEGRTVKLIHFHKDRLPVYGKVCNKKSLKGFLYKYLLFLRCDGIEDADLMKLYLLHCMTNKFEYWRKVRMSTHGDKDQIVDEYKDWELYEPEYAGVEKMIEGLIRSAMKKDIDDKTREQFIVRSCCVVNPIVVDEYGGVRDKTKREKLRDAKKGQRLATDKRIKATFDPKLRDNDNARKAGVSKRRIQEWKADNREYLETLKEKLTGTIKDKAKENSTEGNPKDWIDEVLEKESSIWKNVPDAKKRKDDDFDEIMELLDDLI